MSDLDERSPMDSDDAEPGTVSVTAHSSSPDRVVFTESGNTDGWIATDYTVTLRR